MLGVKVKLHNTNNKVHAHIKALFDEIQKGSKDPEILLQLEIKDGKLGDLPVDRETLITRENINGINCL